MDLNRKNKARTFHKIFSSILAAVFFLNSVLPANAQIASSKIQAETGLLGAYFIQNLRLPESIALTEQTFKGKAQETIWIVKDAHGVPAAQDSIANALSHLSQIAQVHLVGVEGVAGDFRTEFFHAYPDQDQLQEVLRDLWLRGELSGPAMAALSPDSKAHFFGAETPALYEAGLRDYLNARAAAPAYQAQLTNILSQLEALKSETFSGELAAFEKNRAAFRRHQTEATAALLETASKKISGFHKRFPHLSAIAQEFKTSNAFSHQALLAWSGQVSQKIKDKAIRKEWSAQAQLWKTGGLSDAQFAAFTLRFCKAQGWSPRIPDELRALAQRGEILVRMRSSAFVREWNAMLGVLEEKLVSNKQEKALMVLTHQSELLQDWLKLELDRETWKKVVRKFESTADFRELGAEIENLRRKLNEAAFARFYQNAESRENALLENTLKQMHSAHRQSAALVVGGFHADILADILKKKNISHAVLTPAVAEVPKESRYDDLMRGNVSWKEYLRAENGKLKLYESFARAMTNKLLDLEGERKDPTRALANYKNWRENLSRGINGNLARENLRSLSLLDEIVLEAVYPNEYPALKKSWFKTASRIFPVLNRLNKLDSANHSAAMPAMTNAPQIASPLVDTGASFTTNSSALVAASPVFSGTRQATVLASNRRSESRPQVIWPFQHIVHIAFEMAPYFKKGGLGDVVGELPVAMKAKYPDKRVSVILPYQKGLNIDASKLKSTGTFSYDSYHEADGNFRNQTWEAFQYIDENGLEIYFLQRQGGALFQHAYKTDQLYEFSNFSKAAVEFMAQKNIKPDIIHPHDQAAAYVPAFIRETRDDFFRDSAVIFTAHHFAPGYQGREALHRAAYLTGMGLGAHLFLPGGAFHMTYDGDHLNPLAAAAGQSDVLGTVSGQFAWEAANSGLSGGLQWLLGSRLHEGTFKGIVNAIDRTKWGAGQARHPFSESDIPAGKAANKALLQEMYHLNKDPQAPILAFISRYDPHVKGFDILPAVVGELLSHFPNLQVVFAGEGDAGVEHQLAQLKNAYPNRVYVSPGFVDENAVRFILSGSDFVGMPSRIEPAGLVQLQGMLMGAIPIVTRVGGLEETVLDPVVDSGAGKQTGFKSRLTDQLALAFSMAVARALELYFYDMQNGSHRLTALRIQGMESVASWDDRVDAYFDMYLTAHQNRQRFIAHRSEARLRKENAFVNPKDFPHLSEHAIYSRQFEAGLPRHLLESLEEAAKSGADQLIQQFGFDPATAATLAAQVNLTGGLGALMPDLFEAWEANGLPVTGIHPLWNWIKNTPEKATRDGKRLYLGNVIKKFMEPAGVEEYEVKLNITPRYRGYAQHSGARQFLTQGGHKKIMVRVYQTKSHFQGAPQKYLDAYYVEDGKEIPVFGEVYDDDKPLRDFQMAVFSQASQTLIQKIEGKEDPNDIVVLDHEVFVSLPVSKLKSATLATLNHTVFRPGLYEPSENSYELLGFPEWMRSTIAHDGKISIADFTAEAYDLLTGVGLVEHVPALRTNIFRWGWQKLMGFFDSNRRSTNGVYLPRWQSHPRRKLIEDYKKRLNISVPKHGLPVEATDRDFFAELDKPEHATLKKDFMHKNEAVGATDVAELLIWLYKEHKNTWIMDSLGDFISNGDVESLIADLNGFRANINSMITNGSSYDDRWSAFFEQRSALIQALLKDPIGANVRRQVPYKGPDKYVEILQDILLKAAKAQTGVYFDQGALFNRIKEQIQKGDYSDSEFQRLRAALSHAQVSQEAREQMARVIIGGRTFDLGSYDRFLYIRFLANLLGLESRFATVENYNYHEARLIFKGAQAGIMLSDEILEASATSMEKAQTNMAEVIGVFGGAVPEIWIIRDTKTQEIKEVLDKDSDPAMTHDELRDKLQSGEWEILNGILVKYQNGSISAQVGGLRRPSADSLLSALKQLRTTRSNPETRQVRMYNTLASSWKVDMVTSQAQAHAFLLEQTLTAKTEKKKLASQITVADEDWIAAAHAENFAWDVQRENLRPSRRGGLIGFASSFRWLKSWQKPHAILDDRMASRGEDAMAALIFHSKRGDIFNYLLKVLPALSNGAEPLRQKILALQTQAASATKERFVVALNTEAIELVDQYLLNAAGKWLEEYLADGTSPERLQQLRTILEESAFVDERKNEPQQPWAEYLARYLDHHPNAKALATSERGVRSFIFQKPGAQAVLVNFSVSAPSTEEAGDGKTVRKSRATIYLNDETAKVLGGESYSEKALFRVVEAKRGKEFKLHTVAELSESIGTGIEMPLGVEVLALHPAQANLAGLFYQAFQPKAFAEAVTEIEGRLQAAMGVRIGESKLTAGPDSGQAREELIQQLQELAKLDPRSAEHLFTQDGRKAVMAFIFMAAPDLLNSVQNWHQEFFGKLNAMRGQYWEFFQSDSQVRLVGSSRQGTLILARQDNRGNLLFAPLLFHVGSSEINPDGKVNTTVTGHEGLIVSPSYQIINGITGDDYGTRSDLLNNWVNRIPFDDRAQFLVLKPAQRSEVRGGAEEQARNSSSRALSLDSVPALNRSEDRTKTLSPVQLSGVTNRATRGLAAFVKTVTRTFRLPGERRLRAQVSAPGYAAVALAEKHNTHHVPEVIVAGMQEMADQNALSRQTAAEFLAGNGLAKFVAAHFAKHPEMPLHLGFTIPYENGLDQMLLNYAAQITKLQHESEFGTLIHNRLTVLLAPKQKVSDQFAAKAAKAGIVMKQLMRGNQAAQIKGILANERHVFAYGLERFGVSAEQLGELRALAVSGNFSAEAIFNPAVMLNMATAANSNITADLVQQVSLRYEQFVRFNRGSLSLRDSILQGALIELQVRELIASMA